MRCIDPEIRCIRTLVEAACDGIAVGVPLVAEGVTTPQVFEEVAFAFALDAVCEVGDEGAKLRDVYKKKIFCIVLSMQDT